MLPTRQVPMVDVALQDPPKHRQGGVVPGPASRVGAGTIVVVGGAIMLSAYWYRSTNDIAAAYKAYHRARVECALGRAKVDDACGASRRCCIAQFNLPRMGKSAVLQAHLARIDALRPSAVPSTAAADEVDGPRAADVWQNFHDEAELWVKLGKPK